MFAVRCNIKHKWFFLIIACLYLSLCNLTTNHHLETETASSLSKFRIIHFDLNSRARSLGPGPAHYTLYTSAV